MEKINRREFLEQAGDYVKLQVQSRLDVLTRDARTPDAITRRISDLFMKIQNGTLEYVALPLRMVIISPIV